MDIMHLLVLNVLCGQHYTEQSERRSTLSFYLLRSRSMGDTKPHRWYSRGCSRQQFSHVWNFQDKWPSRFSFFKHNRTGNIAVQPLGSTMQLSHLNTFLIMSSANYTKAFASADTGLFAFVLISCASRSLVWARSTLCSAYLDLSGNA